MANIPDNRGDHAGPYGFTRREIVVLTGIIVASVAVIGFDEWRESRRPGQSWAIENVLVAPPTVLGEDSTDSTPEDTSPVPIARNYSDLIDINTADARVLARLPGIGATLAERIVADRAAHGPFHDLTDVKRVNGIGPRKAAMLSGWVTFSTPGGADSGSALVDTVDRP
jgi:competence protein ComEA